MASVSSEDNFSMFFVNITTDFDGDGPAAKAFNPLTNGSATSTFGSDPPIFLDIEVTTDSMFLLLHTCEPNN